MAKTKALSILIGAAGALAIAAGTASAGDLLGHERGSIKDGPIPASEFSWTGFYIGTHTGLAVGHAEGKKYDFLTEADLSGGIYGGQIGYNYQRGMYVVGIEGTLAGGNIEGSTGCYSATCKAEIDWNATLVGRFGVAFDRTLVYSLAGVAWADIDASASGYGDKYSASETHTGWVLGTGIEHALTDRISAKIEYTHTDYGSETHSFNNGGSKVPVKVDAETDTVKLGLNIKLTR